MAVILYRKLGYIALWDEDIMRENVFKWKTFSACSIVYCPITEPALYIPSCCIMLETETIAFAMKGLYVSFLQYTSNMDLRSEL